MLIGRSFDLGRPFVAQNAFTFGGRGYAPGEAFPWRDLGVSELKLYGMWGLRRVCNAPEPRFEPLAGLAVLARIGASIAAPPPPVAKAKAKRAASGP